MNEEQLQDILNRYTDSLLRGEEQADDWASLEAVNDEAIPPLMQLALAIKDALKPVSPMPSYREKLREALEFQAPPEIEIAAPMPRYRKLLMGIAAAGSILSLAGFSIILFRRRRETSQPVTTPA